MANKYLDQNGLLYFWQKIKNAFVAKEAGKGLSTNDYTTAEKSKLAGIEASADVNIIESVKVNGTALTPDATKAVDVSVPTKVSDLTIDGNVVVDGSYVHTDNNYTTAEKTKLAGIEAGADVNIIESVKVNGTALTPSSKAVNIDLSNYATKSDIASVYKYKGTVSSYADLPTTGQTVGDTYNVETADSTHGIKAGDNVAWNGTGWDVLAGTVDLSGYATNTALTNGLAGKVDKETGKGLSTNDYTTAEKSKLAGIATGAEVNVQADWTETSTSSDAYIKNKPSIPVVDSALSSTSTNAIQNKAVYAEFLNYLKTTDMASITNAEIDTIVAS